MAKRIFLPLLLILAVWALALAIPYFVLGQGIVPRDRGLFGGGVPQAGMSGAAIPAAVDLYALGADGWLWRARSCDPSFARFVQVKLFSEQEQAVGIDFRPSDGLLYVLSDNGTIYTLDVAAGRRGNLVRVSALTVPFTEGVQSLADFNPVVDALRLIGSNDQNLAVVNVNGNLGTTAMQTPITYASGDVNQGQNPALAAGAYTNNRAGAQTTIFYGLDFALDTLITIDPGANGSSATGGGQLRTIGKLQFFNGNPVNVRPTADLDIFTDAAGMNTLIGLSGQVVFTLRETDIPTVALGAQQPVTVRASFVPDGGFLDVAARSNGGRCRRGYDD
jgi:hypothetical protein